MSIKSRRALLEYVASFQGQGCVSAEIGVLRGAFSKKIIEILHPKEFWMIDSWGSHLSSFVDYQSYSQDHWIKMMKSVEQKYASAQNHILQALSTDAATKFPDSHFDFIYIDADHDRLDEDLAAWYPKLKNGGVIAGHDYAFVPPRTEKKVTKIEKDVRAFFDNDYEHTVEILQSWWHIKKK